jgi:hypothetical protein
MDPSTVLPLLGMVRDIDPNPRRLAGRFLGLSGEEADAGIPTWAWAAGALLVGVALGVVVAPHASMARNSLKNIAGKARQVASGDRKVFGRYR